MAIGTIHTAKSTLSRLLARVEAGEESLFARGERPVAKLVPCQPPASARKFGALRGVTSPGQNSSSRCRSIARAGDAANFERDGRLTYPPVTLMCRATDGACARPITKSWPLGLRLTASRIAASSAASPAPLRSTERRSV